MSIKARKERIESMYQQAILWSEQKGKLIDKHEFFVFLMRFIGCRKTRLDDYFSIFLEDGSFIEGDNGKFSVADIDEILERKRKREKAKLEYESKKLDKILETTKTEE